MLIRSCLGNMTYVMRPIISRNSIFEAHALNVRMILMQLSFTVLKINYVFPFF